MEYHSSFLEVLARGWFCLLFILGGAIFTFGRSGVVIDRQKRLLREWVGLFFRITTSSYPLRRFERVTISRAEPSGKSKKAIFRVALEGEDQQVDLVFSPSHSEARTKAETIATFVQLDLHDRAQEGSVVGPTSEHGL
jgi:hypothetical protein